MGKLVGTRTWGWSLALGHPSNTATRIRRAFLKIWCPDPRCQTHLLKNSISLTRKTMKIPNCIHETECAFIEGSCFMHNGFKKNLNMDPRQRVDCISFKAFSRSRNVWEKQESRRLMGGTLSEPKKCSK